MKIDEYIEKHQVKPLVESLAAPVTLPTSAYSDDLLLPSFAGANAEGTIFVTTYKEKGYFVAFERGRRRIVGKLDADLAELS